MHAWKLNGEAAAMLGSATNSYVAHYAQPTEQKATRV